MPATPFRGGQRYAQREFCATVLSRLYVHASVMQLKNSIGHGQSDSAAAALGGEVKIEDFFANFFGNAHPLVGDAQHCHLAVGFERHLELAPLGHRLRAVLDHVEGGLLEQVRGENLITRDMFPAGGAGDYSYAQSQQLYGSLYQLREPRKTFRLAVSTTF